MKPKTSSVLSLLLATLSLPLGAGIVWDGGGADPNWGTGANWDDNNPPPTGSGVTLTFAGEANLGPVNNYTAWDDFGGILFASGAGSFNVTGNPIDLFGKIENNSANLQTFGLEFSFNNASAEVNPLAGSLLLNGANVFTNGNTINIWGNNGHTATFDTVIAGTGGLAIQQNSIVILAKNNTYSGANTITAGTLQVGNGGADGNFGSGSMTIGANGTLAFNRTGSFNLGGITSSAGARVRVDLGTVTGTAATSFGSQAAGNLVEVTSGGAINLNGINRGSNHMNLTIAGDGGGAGAIHNTGGGVYSNSGVRNLTLSNNATVTVGGTGAEGSRWDLRSDGTLNLAGFNLTKNGGGNLVIRSTPGSGGTITASAGSIGFEDNFTGENTANYTISVGAGAAIGGYQGKDIRSAITLNGPTAALYDQGGSRTNFTNVTLNDGGRIDQSNRVYGTSGNGIGINGTMAGTGNLVISGGDRGLYLAGTHTFTGVSTLDLQSGHIEINGNANGGNLVSNAVLNLATTANNTRAVDLWAGNAEFRGLTGGNGNIRIVGNNSTTRTLTLNTPASESYTYSGIFQNRTWNTAASPYNLVKTGEGTQIFNNQNSSWSGALTINGGTLVASGASANTNTALGLSSGSRTVTINNGGILQLGSNNVFGGGTQTLANTISVTINPGGTLTTAVYNVVGNITLNGGTLTATGGSSGSYQSYEFNGSTLTVGGSAPSLVSASGTSSGMHIAGGKTLTLAVADVTASTATDLSVSAPLINGSSDRTGAGALVKTGAGTAHLSAVNTFTGGTTVQAGVLSLGAAGSSGILRGSATVEAGATLRLAGNDATGYSTGADRLHTILLNGGILEVTTTGGGGQNQTLGNAAIQLTGGAIVMAATGSNLDFFAGSSSLQSFASATTSTSTNGQLSIRQSSGLTITTEAGTTPSGIDLSISSVIASATGFTSAPLIKDGAGVLELSASNTYTGPTTVSAGTLLVNGSLGNTAVTVENAATLAGKGTLGGSLTFNAGAFLDLSQATNIGLNTADILTVAGNITLTDFTFASIVGWDASAAEPGTYTLIQGGTGVTLAGSTPTVSNPFDFGNGKQGYFQQGSLQVVVVPEPSAALLGGLGMLLLLQRRRRNA